MATRTYGWAASAVVASLATVAVAGETVRPRFEQEGRIVLAERAVPPGADAIAAAVAALVAGPTPAEAAAGYRSSIPDGVAVLGLAIDSNAVTIELSSEVLPGLDESSLRAMFDQFRMTLGDFDWIGDIRLTCQGRLLSSFLAPAPTIAPPAGAAVAEATGSPFAPGATATGTALAGRNITIGPSHGRFWNGSGWYWQRSDPCGYGEAVLEDTNSIRLMQYLYQYLVQDGAVVHVPRELNESTCCHSETGLNWWKMAARYWLQHSGLPSSVWDSSTTDLNDDIRARPLFADYRGSDIYIAHHTNAGGGGTASGTEVYRDTAMEHPQHEANSYTLALDAKTQIEAAIRDLYDASWPIRNGGQPRDSAGAFGEIRIPNRPACLVELAFHDNCAKDAAYLTDDYFRSAAEWGLYKGICQYFGVTPTWDRYSCEYVSDTIPSTMTAGQAYNVSVTFRNRGVLWSDARSFRLGAVGDSDPLTTTTRVAIAGTVRPGVEYTFSFTMIAPTTAGTYTTDWRMVRDGVAWFGPTHSEQVVVQASGPYDGASVAAHSIPSTMTPGEPRAVTITMQNTGTTTWTRAAGYKLGAVGDSDPFAAIRYELNEGESIAPGGQRTFSLAFNAPPTAGTYTTDWQMIREGVGPFGEILSRDVDVAYAPVTLLADNFDSYANQAAFESVWIDTAGSEYQLDTGFGNGGKSVRMVSPSASGAGRYYVNLGATYNATDDAPLAFAFDFHLDASGAPGWSGARHYCELRGYSGGAYGVGDLQNLLAIGVYNASNDTYSTTKYQGRVTFGVNWVTLDEGAAPDRSAGWHRLKIEVTGSEVRFYVDDVLSETEARPNALGFDSVVLGSDLTAAGHTAYVDNVELTWFAPPPTFTQNPSAQSSCAGGTVQFTAAATGRGSLSYRWQKNQAYMSDGGHYSGTATPTLTIANAGPDDVAAYRCVVTDDVGPAASAEAAFTLKAATAIAVHPQSQQVVEGSPAVFSVAATGAGTLSYQWQRNGVDMRFGTNPSLTLGSTRLADAGTYRCIVTGDCGSTTSEEAELIVRARPDLDQDGDVDLSDFAFFQICFNGPNRPPSTLDCDVSDLDGDGDVDLSDFAAFLPCFNGPGRPPACQ